MTDTTKKSTLLLLDGHNIFIRAYSGLASQDLRNKEGVGTWGVYGTLNTIIGMVRRFEPSHVLLAFDKGRSSKRVAIDPEYKANRVKSKEKKALEGGDLFEDFRPQLDLLIQFCIKIGIPHLRLQDVEADDIIAKAAIEYGTIFDRVVIVSADHDIRQLIRDNVIVVKPSLGRAQNIKEEIFTGKEIVEEWGIEPIRLPEIWAIMGDKGDNVPGVPGLGPVKATKLIKEHGDLESVIKNNQKVSEHEEIVRRAFELIKLDGEDNIPFPPLGNLQFNPVRPDSPIHGERLANMFDYFEFSSFKERWVAGTLWKELSFGKKLGK